MNENFFNLKKEKQDKIINAALKVFSSNPYQYASTDSIVKEAAISKGLLFHYFVSKIGLYAFLYDYCVRFILLEMGNSIDKNEKNYFEIIRQILSAQTEAMRIYPCCMMFIYMAEKELNIEAKAAISEKKADFEAAIHSFTMDGAKSESIEKMINYVTRGLMEDMAGNGTFQPDLYNREVGIYIDMIERLS